MYWNCTLSTYIDWWYVLLWQKKCLFRISKRYYWLYNYMSKIKSSAPKDVALSTKNTDLNVYQVLCTLPPCFFIIVFHLIHSSTYIKVFNRPQRTTLKGSYIRKLIHILYNPKMHIFTERLWRHFLYAYIYTFHSHFTLFFFFSPHLLQNEKLVCCSSETRQLQKGPALFSFQELKV